MSTLGPGTTLVARYRLAEPVPTDLVGVESWAAHDVVLDRPVQVNVVRGHAAPAALDAARRAALVSDHRLTRVLDVGAQDGVSYVVSERSRGLSLTQLVDASHVTPDQARSIVGEVATALDVARRRGVHHLALRPEAVRIDGTQVLVTGLGLDAGVAGTDGGSADATSRRDAVALVALLYYLLTTRWGGSSLDVPWIDPSAPRPLPAVRTDGIPADPPSDTPADLASLCRTTLATDSSDGPRTPGDVVASLEPWSTVEAAVPPTVEEPVKAPVRQSIRGGAGARPTTGRIHRAGSVALGGAAAAAGAGAAAPGTPGHGAPGHGAPGHDAGAAPADGWPTAPQPPVPPAPASLPPTFAPGGTPAATGATAPVRTSAVPPAASPAPAWSAGTPVPGAPVRTSATAPRPAAVSGSGGAPVAAAAAAGGGSSSGARKNTIDPTWITLAIVGLIVLVGLVWALANAFSGFEPALKSDAGQAQAEQPADDAAPAPETTASAAPTPTPTPEVRPEIASGEQLDPIGQSNGDTEGEHPEAVDLAIDGQPETFWYTRTYATPEFGGLKDGVGYAIELEQKAPVTTIILDTNNTGGTVEVRATSADKPTDGTVLASAPLADETELTFEATEGTSFVLWFSELPVTADGSNRVELNEILIS
ncbi:hypothetical protein CLV28_1218 [Sediminihabitans luteus]|uniref:Protein kinase domain-containing protein n=1 Tax=Sediminihabitans luteus TaxID=1138585 RepID=A0A2M9D1V1_9CELL|nr:hypothetical protein [Sediminihabitans luteus]PJJ77988.1 hypothetical protein CLV28_1218 [Sediminihabitans luteus]GIJ00638.1 hypothetical protein Slu03_30150 [Sediminihabitans luteus]